MWESGAAGSTELYLQTCHRIPSPQPQGPLLCPQEGDRPGPSLGRKVGPESTSSQDWARLPSRGHPCQSGEAETTAGALFTSKWPVLRASAGRSEAGTWRRVLTRLGSGVGPALAQPGEESQWLTASDGGPQRRHWTRGPGSWELSSSQTSEG